MTKFPEIAALPFEKALAQLEEIVSKLESGKVDLEQSIAGLPPGARTVFVLHDVEGYEHAEIAAMTGIAVGTSKAQLFRARRLLREALER